MSVSNNKIHKRLSFLCVYTHHSISAVIPIYRAHTVSQAGSGGPMPLGFN